ncbi:MAG: MOSC domain-containing protein, partial [Bacteroidota bacterium]
MKQSIKILSVNAAPEGGRKFPVEQLELNLDGIRGDAHAGTIRQVSLFDKAEAERFYRIAGADELEPGQFAENILFETEPELEVKIFDRFVKDEVVLEVTEIGKPFHDKFREPGNYVMP